MRKDRKHINWIWSVMLTLLLASCLGNEEWQDNVSGNRYNNYGDKKDALTIVPSLYQGNESLLQGTTRIEDTDLNISKDDLVDARDLLRENFFGTLDVFVKESTASENDPWFHEYHLVAGESNSPESFNWIIDPDRYDGTSLKDKAEQLLHRNWVDADYDPTKKYDIYVTANNPHTASGVSNLTALKELTTFEHNIYRYYKDTDVEPGRRESYMNTKKNFLMDGSIKEWQIDGTKEKQVFDVDLKRATSKFLLRIKFKKDAIITLTEDDIPAESLYNADTNPTGYKEGDEVTLYDYWDKVQKRVTGIPAWKYVNFGFKSSDIADGTYQLAGENLNDISDGMKAVQTWGSNFQAEYDGEVVTDNMDNHFIITTYSYPMDWSAERDKAPFILLSVAFTKKTNTNDYKLSYYRIPVCDEKTITATDRNKIYIVDAEIASLGSENSLLDMEDQQMMVEYHVVDWTATNTDEETTTVRASDTKYMTVIPTEYTLKGDNLQTVDLNWYASVSPDDSRYMDMDVNDVQVTYVNYQGNTVDIKGTVTKNPAEPNGREEAVTIKSTAPTNNAAHGETVTIQLLKDNIIRVTSEALLSRAVKTIKFRVKLVGTNLYKDVVIMHFPLDNIQNVKGQWSSRHLATSGNTNITVGTWDKAEADSWGVEYTTEANHTEYYTYAEYNADRTHITREGNDNYGQANWRGKVPQNNRSGANSEQNAYGPDSDHYYYWGTGSSTGSLNNYDWSDYWYPFYHQYETYHRARYYRTGTYYTATLPVPSTGTWVDWDYDQQRHNTQKTVNDDHFTAKVYYYGGIYSIQESQSGYGYSATYAATIGSPYTYLNNNSMYVIQVTSTSNKYVLGTPVISNYQSQDKVVSPAFMIASQLGAVQQFSGNNAARSAAEHCGTYMEVVMDDLNTPEFFRGRRLTGWRLPTADEITFITEYQDGEYTGGITMTEVLSGKWYWALDGKSYQTKNGTEGTETNAYVRCVRDLTLDEIEALNGN